MILQNKTGSRIALHTEWLEPFASTVFNDSIFRTDTAFRTAVSSQITGGSVSLLAPPIGYDYDLNPIPDSSGGGVASEWLHGSGAPSDSLGQDEDFYIDDDTGNYYEKTAGHWSLAGTLSGPSGASSVWHHGSGAPSDTLGSDSDFYLDDATGDYYEKVAGTWGAPLGNLAGSLWLHGVGAPSDTLGQDTNFYLDDSTGNYHVKAAGTWSLVGNLRGPQGEQGATGATGAQGTPGQAGATVGTFLVSGGTVAWKTSYTYRVGAATYYVDGSITQSIEQDVSLAAGHATLNRIDVIALDNAGAATVVQGTPAAAPAEPSVDPSTSLKLGAVYVPAASVAASVTQTPLYTEGTGSDWTTVSSGATIVVGSTSNPRSGTKDIEATNAQQNGDTVTLTKPSGTIDLSGQDKLVLYIRVKAAWGPKKGLRFTWRAAGVPKGSTYTVANGSLGFDSSLTGQYQQIAIPMAAFSMPAGVGIDSLRIEVVGSGSAIGFYLDDISLQAGVSQGNVTPSWIWRGTWAATAAYGQNDVVSRSGATYLALSPNTNIDPLTDANTWAKISASSLAASAVTVADSGNRFAATDVESALAELYDGNSAVSKLVTQAGHGLAVGNIVRYDPAVAIPTFQTALETVGAASTTGTGATATIPGANSGLQVGDLVILELDIMGVNGPGAVSASGFTLIATRTDDFRGASFLYRIITGAESYFATGGTVAVTHGNNVTSGPNEKVTTHVYRGASQSTPIHSAVSASDNSGTATSASVSYTPIEINEVILYMQEADQGAPTITSPSGGTLRVSGSPVGAPMKLLEYGPVSNLNAVVFSSTFTFSEYAAIVFGIRPAGGNPWTKAQADTAAHAEVLGIVTSVPDSSHFVVTFAGYISTLSGLTPGQTYFLSDGTAGLLTTTEPTASGHVSKPVGFALSATELVFINHRGLVNA